MEHGTRSGRPTPPGRTAALPQARTVRKQTTPRVAAARTPQRRQGPARFMDDQAQPLLSVTLGQTETGTMTQRAVETAGGQQAFDAATLRDCPDIDRFSIGAWGARRRSRGPGPAGQVRSIGSAMASPGPKRAARVRRRRRLGGRGVRSGPGPGSSRRASGSACTGLLPGG
jgi:hypothetical protein